MKFSTSILIDASPQAIWALLTDAAAWPSWNPTVDKVEGTIAQGQRLKVFSKLRPGKPFPVTVTRLEPDKAMVWSDGMPLGLFKGERTYTLTPRGAGSTEFAMEEVFTGLMLPLIKGSIPDLQPSFEQAAAGLKRRAEQG